MTSPASITVDPPATPSLDPSLTFSKQDLADHLRISTRQVDALTASGDLPQPFLIGSSRRWSRQVIVEFIAEQTESV